MLVLSRKVGESFVIGDEITVTVVRITGGGVRLGIEAPADYMVVRSELQDLLADHPELLEEQPEMTEGQAAEEA